MNKANKKANALNSQYIKNIGIISLAPLISTIMSFFAEPWISRMWGPIPYGIGAYYTSVMTMLSGLMFLRYNFAIVQANTKEKAYNLVALSLIIMSVMLVVVAPFYKQISRYGRADFPFEKYGGVMFFSAAVTSMAILLRFWFSGQKKFTIISGSLILSSASNTILLLIFGFLGRVSEGYMISIRVFSNVLVTSVILISFIRSDFLEMVKSVSLKGIAAVAKEFKRYPLFEYWGFAANTLAVGLPILLITRYWGQEATGYYAKAHNILILMVNFAGSSVNRVLHKEAADIVNRGESPGSLLMHTTIGLSKYMLFPTLFLILLAPEFFGIVLGERWRISGIFAQYMVVWTFTAIYSSAVLPMFGVLNQQLQLTVFSISTLILRVAILMGLGKAGSEIVFATAMFAFANALVSIIQSIYILAKSGVDLKKLGRTLGIYLLVLVPYILAVLGMKHLLKLSDLYLVIISVALALPYVYYFYIYKSDLANMVFAKGKSMMRPNGRFAKDPEPEIQDLEDKDF